MSRKRVLVTGSSRGIGRAIAERLASDGWSIALHYTSHAAEAESVAASLGPSASGIYRADLSEPSNASRLFARALDDGDLHAVVNNAGIYVQQPYDIEDEAAWEEAYRRQMAVNFESPARLMRLAARYFASRGGGKVLNVASRVGFKAEANAAVYAASKAALINLTRSLAAELAPKNVGFFGIAPGWVDTSMSRNGMDDRLQGILATLPLGRMASPADCAAASAFLLSEEAAYLSGVVIDINGASYFH